MSENRLCIFGEVLFDHFPDGKRALGGAPFNVAWHLQAFGQAPHLISRVGQDEEGDEIKAAMHESDMDTSGLQTDETLPTGSVRITLEAGEPTYDIVKPVAYDAIEAGKNAHCRLLYHGSLAVRDPQSSRALSDLLSDKPETVILDVNLRPPWWHYAEVIDMLTTAHWAKLNSNELTSLAREHGHGRDPAIVFMEEHELDGLILTHGAHGAECYTRDCGHFEVQPDADIQVVDTVGAGDAFASVMITGLMNDWPIDTSLQRAQEFASKLVGNRGATVADLGFYQPFIEEWQL